jgi:hypothetical protein
MDNVYDLWLSIYYDTQHGRFYDKLTGDPISLLDLQVEWREFMSSDFGPQHVCDLEFEHYCFNSDDERATLISAWNIREDREITELEYEVLIEKYDYFLYETWHRGCF